MLELVAEATRNPAVRKIAGNPHALDPDPAAAPRRHEESDSRGVRYDDDLGQWTAPFLMAAVNTRVVRRSHALLGYGPSFLYQEAMSLPDGPRGFVMSSLVTAGLASFVGAVVFPPTRALLGKFVLPAPGEGPSKKTREEGFFEVHLLAETEDGAKLRGFVRGVADPGYGETAKMLSEAALCLAFDDLPGAGGVLTPASAMGTKLTERLRTAGMTWNAEG
jgi:short subunit dehydrogenase-like uncharacterized protein